MGFMDELRKLTQPIDDDDDFFEGANVNIKPAPGPSAAQVEFENTFGEEPASSPEPAKKPAAAGAAEGGIFGGLNKKSVKPKVRKDKVPGYAGVSDTQVIFSPKSFNEAGELMNHLNEGRSVVMTLDGLPMETARRLLDFLSGIAFALQGKITPISAKTYFVTPSHVDVVGAQTEQPVSDGQYF